MTPRRRRMLKLTVLLVTLLAAITGGYVWALAPERDGTVTLPGLDAPVVVRADALGIPAIDASTRADALRALGYVTARDRLFQMDLLRRRSAGRLAEIFGGELVELDRTQRHYGFERTARQVVARLPAAQRAALVAYAEGVNALLASTTLWPLEFQLLGYEPRAWRPEDSVLVVLGMFQVLSGSEEFERTRTVLARHLPARAAAFFLSDLDPYTRALLGPEAEPAPALPVDELRALSGEQHARARLSRGAGEAPVGSNGFAVSGARTRDGRAILANDMHLDLSVPNIWYRAELAYEGKTLAGVVLPGVPLVVAGTNGQVAWGLTNLEGDVLDLVELEEHAEQPGAYETPHGTRAYQLTRERIVVRGGRAVELDVRRTLWGPVAERPLLGKPVAVRWSALDSEALDFGLLEMDGARNVDEAVRVMNRAGMPPLNAILADAEGRIAWTLTGRIPERRGFDGATAGSWSTGERAWHRYVAPGALPRRIDPADGLVVSANQRMPAHAGDPLLGRDFVHGYRAYRIESELSRRRDLMEADLFALQLDARSEPFEIYRTLALSALEPKRKGEPSRETAARRALAAWDGRAERESVGFPLLRRFRRQLIERVLGAFLARARAAEPSLELVLADVDTPVLRALREGPDDLFAFAGGRAALLRSALSSAAEELSEKHGEPLDRLSWGEVSRAALEHPLGSIPGLGFLLNMPREPLAGCGFCVRMNAGGLGASERMVVSPGREHDGILHMPAGQSGHPLSANYGDQQDAWVDGRALSLLSGPVAHELTLVPARNE